MAIHTFETLDYEEQGGVGVLTLNRPDKRNAIDATMRVELAEVVEACRADCRLRVLVITGAGMHFCSGGDITGMLEGADLGPISAEHRRQRLVTVHDFVRKLLQFDRPVICAVEGTAFGAGFGLALAGDLVVASQAARFCMSFGRMGLIPDYGVLFTLPRIVGLQRARDLLLTARELDAREAAQWGIVTRVTAQGAALDEALRMARAMVSASPLAISMTKRALHVSQSTDLTTMLMLEADGQGIAMSSDYHRHAVDCFLEKRPLPFVCASS